MRRLEALVISVASVSVMALGIMAQGGASAHADSPQSHIWDAAQRAPVRDWSTGLCLDSNADGNVYAVGCNGGDYQNWTGRPGTREPGGYGPFANEYNLVDTATGRCLDSNTAGEVYTSPCQPGNGWQAWVDTYTLRSDGADVHQYRNLATNRCLDSNGGGDVYTLDCNGGGFQDWRQGF